MTETMQRIAIASRQSGLPSRGNFRLDESPMPEPGPDQFQFRTIWLSVDPYMIGSLERRLPIGATMEGEAVIEVTKSRHPEHRQGDVLVGEVGWVSGGVSDGARMRLLDPALAPISTALGVLGMPGHTAWVALNEIARGCAGETILVSAATGAVGSLLTQLARSRGMRALGVAGGPEKCSFAIERLGCDACLDHRAFQNAPALAEQIAAVAPDGIDIYHDNVGGKTLEAALSNMKAHGRVAVCGQIAFYDPDGPRQREEGWFEIVMRRLTVRGFLVDDHEKSLPTFLAEVAPLVRDKSIVYRESVAEGLHAAPDAFLRLFQGANFGKQLVRVGADPG